MNFFKNLFRSPEEKVFAKVEAEPLHREICENLNLSYQKLPPEIGLDDIHTKAWVGEQNQIRFAIRLAEILEVQIGEMSDTLDIRLQSPRHFENLMPFEHETIRHPSGALAEKYVLTIAGHIETEYLGPQLRDPSISDGLMAWSDYVQSVSMYRRGIVFFTTGEEQDFATFRNDLEAGIRIVQALQQIHPRTG